MYGQGYSGLQELVPAQLGPLHRETMSLNTKKEHMYSSPTFSHFFSLTLKILQFMY